jgi:formamidopyrimidine-DNA glycosylase
MSIEAPEAHILATQMNKELKGKQVASVELKNYENLQKLGCINKNLNDYTDLVKCKIESVNSRGVVILIKLDKAKNLLLAPEYGGKILFHKEKIIIPEKFHLKLEFNDQTSLTVALTGLGGIQAFTDENLKNSYVYRRDFSNVPSPLTDKFTFENFSKQLTEKNTNIKTAIVGKEALVVGLSNNAFQDIIHRAKIHPKRKTSSLTKQEQQKLFEAIKLVVEQRIKAGGKSQFQDLNGNQGTYTASMGPNMKNQNCTICNSTIEAINIGGGQVYFCPKCQI